MTRHTQPTVWLKPGALIIFGSALDTDTHKHHAIQIVWPIRESVCHQGGESFTGPVLINSLVEHQLTMESGWILLIEPQSKFGHELSLLLKKSRIHPLSQVDHLTPATPSPNHDPFTLLQPLLDTLVNGINLDLTQSTDTLYGAITDKRIQNLLHGLDKCLIDDCLKPNRWRASEVAGQVALSESRFLHLFREQMGIAWRPYLLWRRMICAIGAIKKGTSATEAAHIAGFSDSAHLSRSFRSCFGVSIRQAQSLIKAT